MLSFWHILGFHGGWFMVSVWVNSGSWWWTGRLGMLQFMGSQRVRHNWANELNWNLGTMKICLMSMKLAAAAAVKSFQSCPTLCNPTDGSPRGSPIPGILQARTLEWVAISFSSAWKWKVKVKSLSCVQLLAIPRTAVYQALLPMGFSRQEYWSGLPLPSPEIPEETLSLNIRLALGAQWANKF